MGIFGDDFKKVLDDAVAELCRPYTDKHKPLEATTAKMVNFRIVDNRSGAAANDNRKHV